MEGEAEGAATDAELKLELEMVITCMNIDVVCNIYMNMTLN